MKETLEAFYKEIAEEDTLIFGHAAGRDFVLATLGEERAKTVLGQLSVLEGSRTLEALELVDPRTLANFLVNEHPQTVALILAHLEPSKKCEVLKRLPEAIQTEVVLRISNLDFISPNLIAQVDEVLKQELATLGRSIRSNSAVFNRSPKCSMSWTKRASRTSWLASRKKILNWRKKSANSCSSSKTSSLSTTVACRCFSRKSPTTNSLSLSRRRRRDQGKDLPQYLQARGGSLARRSRSHGTGRLSDVENAQQEIVNVAKRLEAEGKIIISRGGEADALV